MLKNKKNSDRTKNKNFTKTKKISYKALNRTRAKLFLHSLEDSFWKFLIRQIINNIHVKDSAINKIEVYLSLEHSKTCVPLQIFSSVFSEELENQNNWEYSLIKWEKSASDKSSYNLFGEPVSVQMIIKYSDISIAEKDWSKFSSCHFFEPFLH